ncbi:MAG: hypothetical protein FDX18_02120 [Chlorobium sp.]|nr:MAG: hypothetical protein FDX18_02120 [Chlorobium sp.]
MVSPIKKAPAPPGVGIWVSVTLLWGTVFYSTSIFMLRLSSVWLGQGFFNPSWSELYRVYGIHAAVLIVFALVAMMVKNLFEPGGQKQIQRWQNISEGKGEKIFISFAGSIATSFFFTGLTAATFLVSSGMLGVTVDFTIPVVLLAALLNIAAGLAASLIVGFIFLVARIGMKKV